MSKLGSTFGRIGKLLGCFQNKLETNILTITKCSQYDWIVIPKTHYSKDPKDAPQIIFTRCKCIMRLSSLHCLIDIIFHYQLIF